MATKNEPCTAMSVPVIIKRDPNLNGLGKVLECPSLTLSLPVSLSLSPSLPPAPLSRNSKPAGKLVRK